MLNIYAKSTLSLSRNCTLNSKQRGPARTYLKGGFTLLEILLVVGIIAILAGIVIVAINPGRQLATVRNTERKSDIKQIKNALEQYYIDHNRYPTSTPTTALTEICDTGDNPYPSGISCGDLTDLSILVPTYITSIPVDPKASTTNGTGYEFMQDATRKLITYAPEAELDVFIAIGTSTPAAEGGGDDESPDEEDPCLGKSIGQACEGTTALYAGTSTINGTIYKYMTTPSDAGSFAWSNEMLEIGATDENNGVNNVNIIKTPPLDILNYSAVLACDNLNADTGYGGYTDWYLPARSELNYVLYANKEAIGGFITSGNWREYSYWSSTAYPDPWSAYLQYMTDGSIMPINKSLTFSVRCVRSYIL
jgi:type IV pilus assembly protein PilA